MKLLLGALIGLILLSSNAQARDAFDGVKCGGDIPKALVGKTMPDGTAVKIEDAHKAIGLKDEGAEEISDKLQMVGWTICGATYEMLIDNNSHIYDVLAFPAHSRATPEFSGTCQRSGKDIADTIYAVLDNKAGFDPDTTHHSSAGPPLPALAAWRIDEKKRKFVAEPIAGLLCPRWGIFTVDGGS
jgi:hypothetical protein